MFHTLQFNFPAVYSNIALKRPAETSKESLKDQQKHQKNSEKTSRNIKRISANCFSCLFRYFGLSCMNLTMNGIYKISGMSIVQVTGNPMRANCAPFYVDVLLYSNERDFSDSSLRNVCHFDYFYWHIPSKTKSTAL